MTFNLDPGRELVRRRAGHLEGRQVLARGAGLRRATSSPATPTRSRVIKTPDDETVVIDDEKPGRPDRRRPLRLHPPRAHLGEGVGRRADRCRFQPEMPLVGSGPYVVTEFSRGRIIRMEPNPEWRGEAPTSTRSSTSVREPGRRRACLDARRGRLGRLRSRPRPSGAGSPKSRTSRRSRARPPRLSPQLAFNLCPETECPDAMFNPAIQDTRSARRSPTASTASGSTRSRRKGTSFVANAILPTWYRIFYTEPEQTYPFDPELANQILDDAGWVSNGDEPRTRDGEELSFDLYARNESPYTTQAAKLIAEMGREIGVEFNVQIVSTDKLTELTIRKVDGKPAPEFDTFIWGWGGDPYDPSFSAQPPHHERDRLVLGQLLLESRIRRALRGAAAASSTTPSARRSSPRCCTSRPKRRLRRPDRRPEPAGLAHRPSRQHRAALSRRRTATSFCEQVSYEPVLALAPASAAPRARRRAGRGAVLALAAAGIAGARHSCSGCARGRREIEPLELEE